MHLSPLFWVTALALVLAGATYAQPSATDHPADPAAATASGSAGARRQAEVARRGFDVMPFSLKATLHVFTKTPDGGVQKVIVRNRADTRQLRLVREHLRAMRTRFLKGDFSGPMHIHGAQMPGLADLEAAKPGQIAIDYKDVARGAELTYRARDPALAAALHRWFDAQVADHGPDAMAGHMNMDMNMPMDMPMAHGPGSAKAP